MRNLIKLMLCLIILNGCIVDNRYRQENDNLLVRNTYSLDHFNFDMFLIDYADLEKLIGDKYSGLVLLSRNDCEFCVENLTNLVDILNTESNFKYYEILIISTDKLEVEEKQVLMERYDISFVPTLLILKDGEIDEIVIGLLSKNQISEIMKGH